MATPRVHALNTVPPTAARLLRYHAHVVRTVQDGEKHDAEARVDRGDTVRVVALEKEEGHHLELGCHETVREAGDELDNSSQLRRGTATRPRGFGCGRTCVRAQAAHGRTVRRCSPGCTYSSRSP